MQGLVSYIEYLLDVDDLEGISYHSTLDVEVKLRVGAKTGRAVDLK